MISIPNVLKLPSTKQPASKHFLLAVFITALILIIAALPLASSSPQNTVLQGINCTLEPEQPAAEFREPVKPVNGKTWKITNDFGNVVTNRNVPGLPTGYWQHTGVDFLLNGSSAQSQNQTVYAAAIGVVVFSTKTSSNKNPVPRRGGMVIIEHIAPDGEQYKVPKYEKSFSASSGGFTISYPAFESQKVFTYYLHLDPESIEVGQGDQVSLGKPIAQTYSVKDYRTGRFTYPPHCHFEVWKICGSIERDGYDLAGTQFQQGVTHLLIDPISFMERFVVSARNPVTPRDRSDEPHFTAWMTSDDYQNYFDRQVQNSYYPTKVEGRNNNGEGQFRAVFSPYPTESFSFDSRHGMDQQYYEEHNRLLLSEVYTRVCLQMFIDQYGIRRYQATWIRR